MRKEPRIETGGPPITLRYRPLGAKNAPVEAIAFARYLTESIHALKQTAEILADRQVQVTYEITKLRKRSPAVVELVPRVRLADVTVITDAHLEHVHTVARLEKGEIPSRIDYGRLQTYRRLGALADKHNFVAEVKANGSSAVVTENMKNRLDLELQKDQWAYGSIIGFIRTYHSAGKNRLIRLYPRVGPYTTCRFQRKDQEVVRSLIDRYVELKGRMRYRPSTFHPYFVDIDEIAPIELDNAPSFGDMLGSMPDLGQGVAPEVLVRKTRDGW